jgi:L-lysine exporter family protein LysE/ArgO
MNLALLKGFATSAGLIVAIGAQNAFVIRQGLMKQHVFLTVCLCFMIDAVLMVVGIVGFGEILSYYPKFIEGAKYFAVVFLCVYGLVSLRSALKLRNLSIGHEQSPSSLRKTVLLTLAMSLLNPHVYLDTVILLGSIALQEPQANRIYFAIGAISASFLWFFGLGYGSKHLAPFLSNSRSWKIIDIFTSFVMWATALHLIIA